MATGSFPYRGCFSEFEVLMKIVHDEAPCLPPNQGFSEEFQSFIKACLEKDRVNRPKFDVLLVSIIVTLKKFLRFRKFFLNRELGPREKKIEKAQSRKVILSNYIEIGLFAKVNSRDFLLVLEFLL